VRLADALAQLRRVEQPSVSSDRISSYAKTSAGGRSTSIVETFAAIDLCGEALRELGQATRPAAVTADGLARLLPALAVTIDVAVFELDARSLGRL